MKCTILHDLPGRLRVHLCCGRMTLSQADVLEYYLRAQDGVQEVRVYDRTQDAVVLYDAERGSVLRALAVFSFAKAEAMEREGVAADFAVFLPRDLPVADMDLCALLGNALDNAIEGSRGAGERRITIRCKADKGLFMLRVENTLGGAVQPDLATTKTDKAAHGFGIPGMREIAERYGGTLDAGVRDNGFELVVCLPLAGQAETL